jgi:hypothetical protein
MWWTKGNSHRTFVREERADFKYTADIDFYLIPLYYFAMEEISDLEWLILDNLSDDAECIATIWTNTSDTIPNITGYQLKVTIYQLYKNGLVYIENETESIALESILDEETENRYASGNYYFGLTPKGVEVWESSSGKYGEPIDWSNYWKVSYDIEKREGFIDGTTKEICLNVLNDENQRGSSIFKEWQIDTDSLKHSDIDGFQAKYYKYISGGHRISFKLKRR